MYEILKECILFKNISEDDIIKMLDCMTYYEKNYAKGETVYFVGDKIKSVGIVLVGGVNIIQEDYWGNRTILENLVVGDIFGESFSYAEVESIPISVITIEKTKLIFIDYSKIVNACNSICVYHASLIRNMLEILAKKNVMLMQKIGHLAKRTTREKLLSYLSIQALNNKSNNFYIPFNRQELADYLSVDRSAMSYELSKMRDENILLFEKNHFILNN